MSQNTTAMTRGGVQALSAVPAIGDELRDTLVAVSAAIAERDDRAAQKMICEILAASTTPPAEQQAQPGAVYAELPQPDSWFHFTAQFWENKLRDFADRTHALRMQAAPKAAPGEQNTVPAEWLEQAYREGWAACRDAETIGEEAEDWAFGNSTANSRMIDAQQAAPKQEAQEPVGVVEHAQAQTSYIHWTAAPPPNGAKLYTAPQPTPAPAPLSNDTKRLDWLDRNIFSREMSEWDAKYGHGPDYNMWVVFSPKGVQGSARNIIDAAIAAQGGK